MDGRGSGNIWGGWGWGQIDGTSRWIYKYLYSLVSPTTDAVVPIGANCSYYRRCSVDGDGIIWNELFID